MYVLQLTRTLSEKSDPLVVSRFFGPAGVALYRSGARLSEMITPVVTMLSNQIIPLTTRYHVTNAADKQRQMLILSTRYTVMLGAFFSTGIFLFAKPFSKLWLFDALGEDYLTVARVMQLWAVVKLFNYAGAAQWPFLLGMKKLRFGVMLNVPIAIFNLILSIYLVGYTTLGIVGVVVGTIVGELIRRPLSAWYVSRITGQSAWVYIQKAYCPALMFLIMAGGPAYLLTKNIKLTSWSGLIGSGVGFFLYAAFVVIILEYKTIRHLYCQLKMHQQLKH